MKKKSVEKNNNIAYWCGALLEGYVPVLHVLCHVEHNSKPVVSESRVIAEVVAYQLNRYVYGFLQIESFLPTKKYH